MNDYALEKIMGNEDNGSRDTALQLLGRRLERHGFEANVNVWEFCETVKVRPRV